MLSSRGGGHGDPVDRAAESKVAVARDGGRRILKFAVWALHANATSFGE